jgi:nucleotide-binding universal stress UspA family protein
MSDTAARSHRIVVGFDGSEGSQRALAWAAAEARQRGAKLLIVRAWTPGEFGTDVEQAQIAQKRLDDDVRAFFGQGPALDFSTQAEEGHAAKVLLQCAEDTDMLVVGSRGRGGFTGLILGSVSQQVATHDGAPVIVIVRR